MPCNELDYIIEYNDIYYNRLLQTWTWLWSLPGMAG